MRFTNSKGFVLITVLFFVLVVGMYSRVILMNGPVMAAMADQASQELLAQRAGEAGASYARAMLRENGEWKGDENRITVNEPDLIIQEDNGNVVGWMRGGSNQVAMFRIRFNYQDGPATAGVGDELDDPTTLFVDNVYASYNNAKGSLGTGAVPVVGDVNPSTYAVDDPLVGSIEVPPGNVVVRVEGIAGRGIQDATGPTSVPNPGAPLLKRALRVVYSATPEPDIPDTAFSAGGGLRTEVTNGLSVQIIGTGTAKMRSKKGVDIRKWDNSLNTLSMTGEIGRDPTDGLNANYAGINEIDETVGDGNDFHNIAWSDVPTASTDETEAVQLPGGIYVVDAAGDYHYYDMTLADYEAITPNPGGFRPGGVALGRNFEEVRSPANLSGGLRNGWEVDSVGFKIDVRRDVNINTSSNGIDDFTITTLSGRKFEETDTVASNPYLFSGVDPSYAPLGALTVHDSIISSQGDMALLTSVRARNGSITSEGDTFISAPSVRLEVGSGAGIRQRLSIYSKGDLTASTYLKIPPNIYVPSYEAYGNLDLEGLIYTWGDANIFAGTPGTDPNATIGAYGNIDIEGALISYGGDPGLFDGSPTTGPGSDLDGSGNSKGKLNLYGANADIKYDRTKLVTDPSSLSTGPGLPGVDRLSYGFEG